MAAKEADVSIFFPPLPLLPNEFVAYRGLTSQIAGDIRMYCGLVLAMINMNRMPSCNIRFYGTSNVNKLNNL